MAKHKRGGRDGSGSGRPRFWGRHAVAAALANPERRITRVWITHEASGEFQFDPTTPLTYAEVADLGRLVPNDAPHQGVVIEVAPLEDMWLGDILTDAPERATLLVLDQVTDPHNVGAILRSAAAFGAIGVVTQDRHSPSEGGALAKAASGALELIPHVEVRNLAEAIGELHELGFTTIGLDSEGPLELENTMSKGRIALVLGAEGKGLRQKTRETVNHLARLDMPGAIKSLNVSNAAAISLYAAQRFLSSKD